MSDSDLTRGVHALSFAPRCNARRVVLFVEVRSGQAASLAEPAQNLVDRINLDLLGDHILDDEAGTFAAEKDYLVLIDPGIRDLLADVFTAFVTVTEPDDLRWRVSSAYSLGRS